MNPFDLTGPPFLLFYFGLGACALLLVYFALRWREIRLPIPKLKISDPYQIAFLRGGANEAIRIASVSLIDRGLLMLIDTHRRTPRLITANEQNIGLVKIPLEKALLRLFSTANVAQAAFKDDNCKLACVGYGDTLGAQRLVRTMVTVRDRIPIAALFGVLLTATAIVKIELAVERGRPNIGFLVILCLIFLAALGRLVLSHRTGLGDVVLADLKKLFSSLHNRRHTLRRSRNNGEASLFAAVFGITALPDVFQFARDLFRKKSPFSSKNGSGRGGGEGCGGGGPGFFGAGASDGGGSSCGGGGSCGGGCGGCGS